MDNTIKYFVVVDRYDMDFDDDVLYCYEIQLEADVMRQGLGRLVPFPFSVSRAVMYGGYLSLSSSLLLSTKCPPENSVADPGPGAFLTPRSGIGDA